jgi:hypothetical protein
MITDGRSHALLGSIQPRHHATVDVGGGADAADQDGPAALTAI